MVDIYQPATDRIFGYASPEPNIRIFGAASAEEYLAFAAMCLGSCNKIAKIFGDASIRLKR